MCSMKLLTKRIATLLLFRNFLVDASMVIDEQDRKLHDCHGMIDPFGMVIVESTRSLDATYDELIQRLDANPAIFIASEFDHAANAERVGLNLAPTRLVVFGNPALGTPLMQQNALAGLDLPQKMLIWMDSDSGKVYIGYNNPMYLVSRYGRRLRNGAGDQLETITNALGGLAAGAAGVEASSINIPQLRRRYYWNGLHVSYSKDDFETTWDRLLAAIEASPADIAFTVDHSQNAENIGLSLGPSRLVVFGNPRVGTPFMAEAQTAGIDLPLKILVSVDHWGHVLVTTNRIDYLSYRHGFCEADLTMAQTAVMNFVGAATGK